MVGFLMRRFDLKTGTGIDFAHFGLESGMFFEGTTAVSQGLNVFQMNKKQRIICEFEMYLRNLFIGVPVSAIKCDYLQVWKRVWIL